MTFFGADAVYQLARKSKRELSEGDDAKLHGSAFVSCSSEDLPCFLSLIKQK